MFAPKLLARAGTRGTGCVGEFCVGLNAGCLGRKPARLVATFTDDASPLINQTLVKQAMHSMVRLNDKPAHVVL